MAKRKEGEISIDCILWSYTSNNEGLHPVKYRIIHQRESHYYPVYLADGNGKKKLFMSQGHFTDIMTKDRLKGKNKEIKKAITDTKRNIEDAIEEATNGNRKPFSWGEFERKYLGADASKSFLISFKKHIDKLTRKGQAGTVRAYSSAYNALREFLKGDIDPADITKNKLEEFDLWLRTPRPRPTKSNKKATTIPLNDTSVSIYMRCIRSVYNELVVDDDYLKVTYPFSQDDKDKKYKIPSSSGGQKGSTLTIDDINDFINGKVEGDEIPVNPMYRAKQLFLFSFFAQGANFKDLALLKYSDIQKDTIEFDRQKTIRTKKKREKTQIPITEPLNDILIEQGNPNKDNKNYVFEVFNPGVKYTPKQQDDTIRQWVKTTNKWLARYCEFNNLEKVTTYSARHSFASIAKSNLSVAQISKMLGHSRITTTQAYLGRFTDSENRAGLNKVFSNIKRKSA